jgi:hypothetical protein
MGRLRKKSAVTALFASTLIFSMAHLVASQKLVPQIQTGEIKEQHHTWSISIKYPYIVGTESFNAAVGKIVHPLTKTFIGEIPPLENAPSYPGYVSGKYSYAILKDGIISVLIEWDEYYPAAAHPGGGSASVNYDTSARRVLSLSDLFRRGADYVRELSRLATIDLAGSKRTDDYAIQHGAGPVESNFKVFTLTDTDLVLHFQPYQVGPGAQGSVDVTIPLTELRPILRKRWIPPRPHTIKVKLISGISPAGNYDVIVVALSACSWAW